MQSPDRTDLVDGNPKSKMEPVQRISYLGERPPIFNLGDIEELLHPGLLSQQLFKGSELPLPCLPNKLRLGRLVETRKRTERGKKRRDLRCKPPTG